MVGIAGSAIATGQTPTRFATLSGVGLEGNTNGTWAVTSGDVNGDGARDIIVADYTGGESQLWLNDGRGHFEVSAGLNGLKQEVYAVPISASRCAA